MSIAFSKNADYGYKYGSQRYHQSIVFIYLIDSVHDLITEVIFTKICVGVCVSRIKLLRTVLRQYYCRFGKAKCIGGGLIFLITVPMLFSPFVI